MDIYLMGIGGTGMGALAGLLKSQGHHVRGSDSAVYSPMREKLADWGINYLTPYDPENLKNKPDLIIVGNVIRRDNPEAQIMQEKDLPYESFPSALKRLFLNKACSIVASGTHGKTTCSALISHVLYQNSYDPGFLIGGIPLNFNESFRAPGQTNNVFVVEGDEYDTAYFDKSPKFMHYRPDLLLLTSIEFDHGDIYADLDAVIRAFTNLLSTLDATKKIIINHNDQNIRKALSQSQCQAKIMSYGPLGNYQASKPAFLPSGLNLSVLLDGQNQGEIAIPLFGHHNLSNALGCYAILHQYGLSHEQISAGFKSFLGVKRRLEVRCEKNGHILLDDFAHHPTAVCETIKAVRQKYPKRHIIAIFEPRSATSAGKVFTTEYIQALSQADQVILAPVGRNLAPDQKLPTKEIALKINFLGKKASAHDDYDDFKQAFSHLEPNSVLLFMSNGDLGGNMQAIEKLVS